MKTNVRRITSLSILVVIVFGGGVLPSSFLVGKAEEFGSQEQFIAEYGGYGEKEDWITLGNASAGVVFSNEEGFGWIQLGENEYQVEVSKEYDIEEGGEFSTVYKGNITGNEGTVRFVIFKDVIVGEIEVGGSAYSFGVAQTLESGIFLLDNYNSHLQEEGLDKEIIKPPPFLDVYFPADNIPAEIDFDPDTLNLKGGNKWITVYIELLADYNSSSIDLDTVRLNDAVLAENDTKYGFVKDPEGYLMDHDNDGILERIVKFDRGSVQEILDLGDRVRIEVTGSVIDGKSFYGVDWIEVIGEKDTEVSADSSRTVTPEEKDNVECIECLQGEMGTLSEQQAESIAGGNSLYQRFIFTLPGGYVTAGTGMRNRGYGDITISGIPAGSTIENAYLYWDILDDTESPSFAQGNFNGNPITGTKIGEGADPCWAPTMNFAYRADVTSYVTGNGIFSLTDFASGRRDGYDPWLNQLPTPQIEGASLVVVYRNPTLPMQNIIIYDGAQSLIGTEYSHTITGFTASSPVTSASITYIGADGQTNGAERTYFNGVLVGDNDWDGSDPQAGAPYRFGNLWDTNTYDVTTLVNAGATSATARTSSINDCLVWVSTVFSVITSPQERIVTVYAAADKEYIQSYDRWWYPWDEDDWKLQIRKSVELGDDAFEREHQINFVVKEIGTWDSTDDVTDSSKLFAEAWREIDKGANDIKIAFTGQNMGDVGGVAGGDTVIVTPILDIFLDNLHQHEYSHLFGAEDHDPGYGNWCVMSYAWFLFTNNWDTESSTIANNKWKEF